MNPRKPFTELSHSHVSGQSLFVDDLVLPHASLVGRVVYSKQAHALIREIGLTKALETPGVVCILTAADIPGTNNMGPVVHDEPCLARDEVNCIGQAIALIAANSFEAALNAEKKIILDLEPLEAITTLEAAIAKGLLIAPERKIESGDVETALAKGTQMIEGELATGAQEHWYLETQAALAVPGEGHEMKVFASSQNPSETQAIVAEVLGIDKNAVEVEVKRMGGAFGGKETQANHVAAWASLLANACGKAVSIRLCRDDDQIMTGKRHRFLSRYQAAFDSQGVIQAYSVELNADAGCATDLSLAILERAMLHAENAYYIPNVRITGRAYRTNLPSNTAFRGFGGPQGIAVIETVIDRIARTLHADPALIRQRNFYRDAPAHTTPYGAVIKHNHLAVLLNQLTQSSGYFSRRQSIAEFNQEHALIKRGIALTPVKFGISFTTSFLNQAGALVHIYNDGSLRVNHGGTEMGQGLHAKMQGIVCSELGLPPEKVLIDATNTSRVPNTSATAASSGSDLNGMALMDAIAKLKERLQPVAINLLNALEGFALKGPYSIQFADGQVFDARDRGHFVSFGDIARQAYLQQISLSATGYYRTPGIMFDRQTGKGNPFYYYAYGMAVAEVETDTLSGEYKVLRADILHDTGRSLNPKVDLGQVEGAFMQGIGWCTTEEIKWDTEGHLMTPSPDTYKIPTINELPEIFRVALLENQPNPGTVGQSKAVGEPPFMLALSVWLAIKDSISAVADHQYEPPFSLPATPEQVLYSITALKTQKKITIQ